MAESYDYLYEEVDISGDLLPCEFCGCLFPSSILIEHSSGCNPDLFLGTEELDLQTKFFQEHIAHTVPVVKPDISPKPHIDTLQWDEKVLFPKAKNSASIMIEQLVRNDIYDIKPKDGGGSVMKKLSNINTANEKKTPNVGSEKMNNDTSNTYIHFKTDINEQGESDSDDDEPPQDGPGQAKSFSSGKGGSPQDLDAEDSIDLSDDNNEENETIESFLLRASLELNKIKMNQERFRAKLKESQYARYYAEEEEEEAYRKYEARNIYHQDCY